MFSCDILVMKKMYLELHFDMVHLAGLVVATFCYRQFFPNPYDDNGIHLFSFVVQDVF